MYRACRIAYCGFANSAVLLYALHSLFHIARIVQRVEYTHYIDSVFNGFTAECIYNVISIMLVTQNILSAQKHLKLCFRHSLSQCAKSFPRVLIQKTHTSIKRSAAPTFKRPIPHIVKHFARREHIFKSHSCCRLRLMRVTKNSICNI